MSGARIHPKYSGSNAHRFMSCPGQVRLAASLPDIETQHSIDGTFAHAVLEEALNAGLKDTSYMVGVTQIKGRWVDDETAEAVQHVIDYVAALRLERPDLVVFIEWDTAWPGAQGFAGGTIDVWCCTRDDPRKVWIIDFKYGAGERVDADDNKQLMFYSVSKTLFALRYPAQITGVIIQPRHWAYQGPRVANFSYADLFDFWLDAEKAIDAAEKPDAPLAPGTWCKNCKAAAVCPALERAVSLTWQTSYMTPDELNVSRLAFIIEQADQARQWLKACEDYAFRLATRDGRHVPGFKIVRGAARRRWRPDVPPERIADHLCQPAFGLSLDAVMPRKLRALTDIEKAVVRRARENALLKDEAAEAARKAFAFLTLKDVGGGLSLVPETDPRPAYNPAADDFAGITIEHTP